MSKAQDLQHVVFWSIVGPVALVASLFLFSLLFLALPTANPDSWVIGVGAVLHYCTRFGAVIAAPVVTLFGLLGLLTLPNKQVKHKSLTLAICAAALAVPLAVVAALYVGR